MQQQSKLHAIVSSALDLERYELVGIEMLGGAHTPLVRIYVDTLKGGITIDEISTITKHIKSVLEVAQFFTRDYQLEVSSPGLDRPLFTLEQFRQHLGEKINIKLAVPLEGRHNFKGVLQAVTDKEVILEMDDDVCVTLPFSDIAKARLIPQINFGQERKHEAD